MQGAIHLQTEILQRNFTSHQLYFCFNNSTAACKEQTSAESLGAETLTLQTENATQVAMKAIMQQSMWVFVKGASTARNS